MARVESIGSHGGRSEELEWRGLVSHERVEKRDFGGMVSES